MAHYGDNGDFGYSNKALRRVQTCILQHSSPAQIWECLLWLLWPNVTLQWFRFLLTNKCRNSMTLRRFLLQKYCKNPGGTDECETLCVCWRQRLISWDISLCLFIFLFYVELKLLCFYNMTQCCENSTMLWVICAVGSTSTFSSHCFSFGLGRRHDRKCYVWPCRHMKIHDKDPNTVLNSNPPSPTKRRRLCAKRKPSVEDDGDIADQSPNKKVLQYPLQVILVSLVLKWREQTVEVGSILLEYTKIY